MNNCECESAALLRENFRVAVADECFKYIPSRWDPYVSADKLPKELSFVSPRGTTASFQFAVEADRAFILDVGKSGWFDQSDRKPIVRADVRVSGPASLPVSLSVVGKVAAERGKPVNDVLLSAQTFAAKADEPVFVFVTAEVSGDAPAGDYEFEIRLFRKTILSDEEALPCSAKVRLRVYSYTLPPVHDRRFYLDLWQHNSNIARYHETELYSDAHFDIIRKYLKTLADLGQRAATLIVTDIPWKGQGCYIEPCVSANLFEYSIVPITRAEDGSFRYDFTKMQRYIDLCAELGIDREISLYGLCNIWKDNADYGPLAPDYPDALRVRYYDEASGTYKYMRCAADIDAYIRALHDYFITTGQIDRVRVAADEPADIEAYRASLGHLSAIAPRFRFKAAINHSEFIGEFGKEVDDYAPHINGLCREYDKLLEYKNTLSGKRFLWYICCGPTYPNTFLQSPLTESYVVGLFNALAGFDGLLRWAYTCWTEEPRSPEESRAVYPAWQSGDTHFVYPSRGGAPLLSLRYMALKKGIELYELIEEVRARGKNDVAEAVLRSIFRIESVREYSEGKPRDELWSSDYSDFNEAERMLCEALSE